MSHWHEWCGIVFSTTFCSNSYRVCIYLRFEIEINNSKSVKIIKLVSGSVDDDEQVGIHLLQVRGETLRATELGWRNIIFIPFNNYWLIVVTAVAVYMQISANYYFIFENPWTPFSSFCMLISWIVLVIDLLLSVIHRLWERVNRSQRYVPKSLFVILVDTICAHPVLILHFMVFKSMNMSKLVIWFVVVVDFLRLYRIFVFYDYLKSKIGLNQLLVHLIFYDLILVLLADIMSIVWHTVSRYTENMALFKNLSSDRKGFWYIHMLMCQLVCNTSSFFIKAGTILDVWFLIFPVILSFTMQRVIVIILLMDIMKRLDHQFQYRSTLKVADVHLSNIGVKKGVKEDFLNFYDTLWDLWWGITWEESLEQLPLSLCKETLVDISWDAIQHSRSLRFLGLNFKREIALKIRSVSYRPGDFVFDYGDTKSTLFYLVSGTLQVMSSHDRTCPLISFSRGTILGGGSIIVPSISNLAVRSASYSETHMIDIYKLFQSALSYPWEVCYMHLRSYDRLQDAYTMMKVGELFDARKKMYDEILVEPEVKCITWLKKRWQLINSYDVTTVEEAKEIVKNIPVTEQYTSRYLDMYVISEDLELKKNRFCLEAAWPYVMEPECDFLKLWNAFVLFLLCFDCIALPYYAAFSTDIPYLIEHLSLFNQIMFMLDTYFHLITAIKTKDVNIMTAKAIIKYRLKRVSFVVDLISAFPLGIFIRVYFDTDHLIPIYGDLLRLFKTWRALKLLGKMESDINNPPKMPWLRHIIVYILLIYWSSCIMFIMACPRFHCKPDSWFLWGKQFFKTEGKGEDIRCFKSYLTISLYFVMTVTRQLNSSILSTESFFELLMICVLTLIIQTYVLYCTAHLIAVDLLNDSLQISFISLKKKCAWFFKSRTMSNELGENLIQYLDLQWSHNMAHEFLLQKKLFHDAPQKLNAELTNHFKAVFKSYKIFQGDYDENRHMIDKLAEKARIVMLPKHFVICDAGFRASCLTIVRKGYCSLNSHLRSDIEKFPSGKLIGAGAIFPLLEIFSRTPSMVTVYTVTNCECIIIDEPELIRALDANTKLKAKLSPRSKNFLDIKNTLKNDYEREFHPVIPDTHQTSTVLRSPFFCDLSNTFRSLLHLLFPKFCFSPLGAFIYYWELFRFITIPITTNFYILYFIIFFPQYPTISVQLSLIFDGLSMLDIYFRLNTGYFNKHGVLVTDTCLVTYRYLTTAFVVDFMAAFPWQILFRVQRVVDLPWLLLSTFKTLSLYRVIRFKTNLSKSGTTKLLTRLYTVCALFATTLIFISCNYFIYTCFIEYKQGRYERLYCKIKLVSEGYFKDDSLPGTLAVTVGLVMGMMGKMRSMIEQAHNEVEMIWTISIGLTMNLLEILFVVKCCRWSVSAFKNYLLFKQNVESLVVYLKKNLSDSKITSIIEKQFMFYWKRHLPDDIVVMIHKIHPILRVKLFNHLYYDKLRMISFLRDADEYLLRAISFEIKEMYVIKGQAIVEEFEITKHIYMIWEGEVVVSVGKISPVVLGPGCIFGSLSQNGITKHVFSFEASKNSAILLIESSRFYTEMRNFPSIYRDFIKLCLPAREYIVTGEEIIRSKSYIDLSEVVIQDYMTTSSSKYILTYLIVTYVVAYATIIVLSLSLLYGVVNYIFYSLIVIDVLTLWKIVTQFLLPYVEPQTGLTVRNRKLIRKRYMKTVDFYIDVITFFPYVGIPWLLWIKLLRIIQVTRKVKERRASLISKNWEVWIHCFLSLFMIIFLLAVIWSLQLGRKMNIYKYSNGTYYPSNPTSLSDNLINSFLFVSILFTGNGRIKNIKFPTHFEELIGAIIITSAAIVIAGIFLGWISHFVENVTWHKRLYENKMQRLFQYLKLRELSQCILESVWEHGELLWHRSQGRYIPPALFLLPYPLKKGIAYKLFGRHLENSYLFKHTHVEFIKNLCARLEIFVFFPGESVVMEGDVDGTMYFIHSGEVDVLKNSGRSRHIIILFYLISGVRLLSAIDSHKYIL